MIPRYFLQLSVLLFTFSFLMTITSTGYLHNTHQKSHSLCFILYVVYFSVPGYVLCVSVCFPPFPIGVDVCGLAPVGGDSPAGHHGHPCGRQAGGRNTHESIGHRSGTGERASVARYMGTGTAEAAARREKEGGRQGEREDKNNRQRDRISWVDIQ